MSEEEKSVPSSPLPSIDHLSMQNEGESAESLEMTGSKRKLQLEEVAEVPNSRKKNLRVGIAEAELKPDLESPYFESLSSGPSDTRPRSHSRLSREQSQGLQVQWECVVATTSGRRPYNEDRHSVGLLTGQSGAIVGIYDGHGGAGASQFVSEQMSLSVRNLQEDNPKWEMKQVLASSFNVIDDSYLKIARDSMKRDGTTAIVAVLNNDLLTIANAGDCRAVLSRGDEVLRLSDDHKPNREDEKNRIEGAGGKVVHFGCWRVISGTSPVMLAVSRALGDPDLKKLAGHAGREADVVSSEPEVEEVTITPGRDAFLVLASDGLWDVFKDEEVVEIVKDYVEKHGQVPSAEASKKIVEEEMPESPASSDDDMFGAVAQKQQRSVVGYVYSNSDCREERAGTVAEHLIRTALQKGTMDNVTCAVLFFRETRDMADGEE
mmetsp:Transcript_10212/g.26756  ORF Transcript_10212/g.26756 Transcript_10212/m.26756 type:complete len:435 (-) Transcript_10212:491-1795(-)